MADFISRACWMRDIYDATPLTMLTIPGTHNSACVGGTLGFGQTQNLDLVDQLAAGIRFLDIRLARCQDTLCVHHDVACMSKSYTDVLDICADFLHRNPSETIFMSIKDEACPDRGAVKYSPSEILGRLRLGDAEESDKEGFSFAETLRVATRDHVRDTSLFFNFANGHSLTPSTTLRQVRGMIILLRRFDGPDDFGVDLTYWPENQTFRSAAPPIYDVHDRYQGLDDEEKYGLVVAHVEEAKSGSPEDLYITFTSAVDLTARGFAMTINPRLCDYLASSPRGRAGIIVMDYFEEPRELVSTIISMNEVLAEHRGPPGGPGPVRLG
jgi:1-phosphatidylinositol phosphodiesterase